MPPDHPSHPSIDSGQNPYRSSRSKGFSLRFKVALVTCGLIGMTLLGLAFYLEPSPDGFGTHQQLGFPPCAFIEYFEIPCPSCGMTTSWSYLMAGQPILAFRSNFGGALLCISALVLTPWFLVSGIRGKWWITRPNMVAGYFVLLGITLITMIQWLIWVLFFPI